MMFPDQFETEVMICDTASRLLPEEDWGTWSPSIPREPRPLPLPISQKRVTCFQCGQLSYVPLSALSAICSHCRIHMQLSNVLLRANSRRRRLETQGDITVASGAQLHELKLKCQNLTMKGEADGEFFCRGTMRVYASLRLSRALEAGVLELRRAAQLVAERGAMVGDAVLRGKFIGLLNAKGVIRVKRGGLLQGDCRATSLIVESGGRHIGSFSPL